MDEQAVALTDLVGYFKTGDEEYVQETSRFAARRAARPIGANREKASVRPVSRARRAINNQSNGAATDEEWSDF